MKEENLKNIEYASKRILYLNAYLTQVVLLLIAGVLIWVFNIPLEQMVRLQSEALFSMIGIGLLVAGIVLLCEWILTKIVSKEALDEGGINKLIFGRMSVIHILIFCLLVSVVEELLFRAVIQTLIGLVGASLLFAIIHVRYLRKPVLFGVMVAVSFSLGLLFQWTNHLVAPITAHFFINFIAALFIRFPLKKSTRSEMH
ncbi:CPBP family intramembrane glutamic endopeptidase [Alkalihalobacillus sp. FSL R5-0424]